MSKVVKVVAGAAIAVVGVVTGNIALVGAGVSTAIGALTTPRVKQQARQASVTTLKLGEAPRQAIFGEAVTGGSLVDAFNYGGKYGTDWEVVIIAVADHECEALVGFYVNDKYVAFTGDGTVAGYNNQLQVYFRKGTENQTLPSVVTSHAPVTGNGPSWTANDNGAGVAYVVAAYKADDSEAKNPVWTQGRPRFKWRVKGAKCYIARKDSTAGGSGAHRRDDPATWEWTDNLIDCRYNWVRGLYACNRIADPNMLLVGRGLSAIEAPPQNTFAPANLCDELVDGEKRYTMGGVVLADEPYINTEEMFAAACGGVIVQPEGSVEIEPGQAKAAVAYITDADLVVGSKVEASDYCSEGDREWVNTVIPRYVEPAQGWADHAAPILRETADVIADKRPREEVLSLPFVNREKQALRVGEMRRRIGRLLKRRMLTLGPRFCEIEEGDWIVWTSQRYLKGGSVAFRVDSYALDQKWQNTLRLREIGASVFSAGPFTPGGAVADVPNPPPSVGAPAAGAWALTAEQLSSTGTSTLPALIVTGAVEDRYVEAVRFEYWKSDGVTALADVADWTGTDLVGPGVRRREIATVAPGAAYYAAVSYVVNGIPGERRYLGPVTVGQPQILWGDVTDDGNRPEDGATNGAPPGTNVGGVPAEQVADAANQVNDPISGLPQQIIRIEEIRVDVTALQETYGDTEAAAASAAVAEQAKIDALAAAGETDADRTAVAGMATTVQQLRDETSGLVGVAQGHALVAQDKAGEASASAGQSSASAIEAAGSASAANNSKVQAQSLKDQTQSLADAAQSSSVTAGSHAAAALQSATLAAQVGGGGLIKNPVFSDWVNGGSLPQNWGEWATPFQRTKASGSFGSPNAVYEKNDSGQNSGFSQDITNIGPGKYLVEISVKLRDGPLNGAGLYLVSYSADYQSYYNVKLFSLTNALTSDGVNVGNGVALTNKLLNFSFVFDTTQNPNVSVIRLYCMTGWSEFGTANVSKWLEWHRANIKPITALEAAVMNDAGAIVEVGKRAMSFLQLETTASGLGNSATAMVSMRSEVVAGQAPTSLIALLANEIHLANGDQAGTVRKALSVAAGDTIVYGNLNVGAKLLIGSRLLAVAVQPFFVEAKDGVAVDFGTPVGDYRVDFDLSALPAPASGQSYKADALNKSPTGFLPSIKLTTQGTPSTITSTGAVTTGSAPSRRMQKANVADAANGYYTFAASGLATAFTVTYGNPGYVQIEILCYVKSPTLGWQYIGSLHTDVDGPINKGSRQAAWTVNGAVYFGGAIGLDAGGDYEFGIDFSVTGTGSVDSVNFNSVTYAAQPTTGGTTSVSQTVPARITPVNG